MPYRRTPSVQARLDASRAAILGAAVALLAEHGYAGCSVAAVAARARVATGSVYQHFPSKSVLVDELFRMVCSREVAAVAAAAERAGGPVAAITAVVRTFAGRALRAPRLAYALLAEPVDPAVDAARLEFRVAFRDVLAARIDDAVAGGALPQQDPRLTAAALVGAVGEALVGPLSRRRSEPAAPDGDVVPALVTFTLRALGGRDASDP